MAAAAGPPAAAPKEVATPEAPVPAFIANPGGDGKPWGAVAEFANPHDLLLAAARRPAAPATRTSMRGRRSTCTA